MDAPVPQLRLNRFDANGSTDREVMNATDRLITAAFSIALAPFGSPPAPMPPAVRSAREPLIEKASVISCERDRVAVIGRPLPRAPDETREFGQGDFEVESLVDLVERTLVFVCALQNAGPADTP
jgi:hypothetical protein